MYPIQINVTSADSPKIIMLNRRGGSVGVTANPTGAGNYTIEYTTSRLQSQALPAVWNTITTMDGATTAQDEALLPIEALRVTLNSGTSVEAHIVQSDVA